MSDLRDEIFGRNGRVKEFLRSIAGGRPAWFAVAALTAAALLAATACDQGFTVESSPDGGGSGSTPAVAFKTPRTKAAPEVEPTPTSEADESPTAEAEGTPPAEEATPTSAPTTEAAETEAPTTETPAAETPTPEPVEPTPSPTATVERTLVPAEETPTPEGEATQPDSISPEMQAWLFGFLGDLTAGRTAVRPFEFDPGLVVQNESNTLLGLFPLEFLQAAFDAKVHSSYFVQALQPINPMDPTQHRHPVGFSELILVHESEADAASFVSTFREVAIPTIGALSEQYIQTSFPDAQRSFQEDTGFGIAEEEFVLVGEYDLGIEGPPVRPQVYIMIGRQGNVSFGLMVLYMDSQSRMRPFALFDRLVSRIG